MTEGKSLQTNLPVQIVLLDEACKPYTTEDEGEVVYDLRSRVTTILHANSGMVIPLGIKAAFSNTHRAFLYDRSGIAGKKLVSRFGGVIEGSYRGEWGVILYNHTRFSMEINKGDRVCQVVFKELSKPDIQYVDELPDSTRGENGFGSSGVT